jgi:crotonobetainyl-CoA:carnitine CoA-transferase CaiB-like acyl-CoA transferase
VRRNPESGEHTAAVLAEVEASRAAGPTGKEPLTPAPEPGLPFEDLRVLELATGLAGPYCGSLLADQGADVLKLESHELDRLRSWGPPFVDGVGAAFVELNRNKRLAALPDADWLVELARGADVVIVDAVDPDGNPPPIDLRRLRDEVPSLIVCSLSSYGEKGPLAGAPGSELTVQAMCNTWGGLGAIGQEPRRLGADQAHMNAGLAAYQGIAAALFRRERTGEGDRIEASALGAHHAVKGMHWTSRSHPDQWPGLHLAVWTDPPNHGIRTKDRPILLQLSKGVATPATEEQVRALVESFGGTMPVELDLTARFGNPKHPMHWSWVPFWSSLFENTPWQEVARIVDEHGGEVTPFMDYAAFDSDPQIDAIQPFATLAGTDGRVVRLPWRLGNLGASLDYAAPRAGEPAWASREAPAPVGS